MLLVAFYCFLMIGSNLAIFFWRFSHVVLLMFSDGRVFFREEKFGNYIEATRVARREKPPALAAAVLRPGRQRWIDINDLHCSLGHAHDTVLRETARQMGINVTGRLGYWFQCVFPR